MDQPLNSGSATQAQDTIALKTQLEIEKVRLENAKLREEINELQRPYWKRPGFWGAVIPSILAVLGVTMAYFTGTIETELKLLDFQQEKLKDETVKFNANRDKFDADKIIQDKRIADLEEKNKTLAVASYLEAMDKEGDRLWPLNNIVEQLVNELNAHRNPVAIKLVRDEANKTNNEILRAHLLAVLYLATADKTSMDRLMELASSPNNRNEWFWRVFGTGRLAWSDSDRHQILAILGNNITASGLSTDKQAAMLGAAYAQARVLGNALNRKDAGVATPLYKLIKVARDLSRDLTKDRSYRALGLSALQYLDPRVFIVVASELIVEHAQLGVDDFSGIFGPVENDIGGIPKPVLQSLGVPSVRAPAAWEKWQKDHRALVGLVMDSNSHTWQANIHRIDEIAPLP